MPVARTLRPLTPEEAALVEMERARHRRAMTPSPRGLALFLVGAAGAAGLAVLLTGLRAPVVGAAVFGVAALAAAVEHLYTARRMARTPTRWDPPSGAGWEVMEHTVLASRVVEVGDPDDEAGAWFLFCTPPAACYVVAREALTVANLKPVRGLEPVARERVTLRRLHPGGRLLPVLSAGAMIPARAFSRQEGTWRPARSLPPDAPELALRELPEWLREALA